MFLLYFNEEVVPCSMRQSISCSLNESSGKHKNILIKDYYVQGMQFTLFIIELNP